jgi:hypothetical protein
MRQAMALERPPAIPVMCQLSVGHILLNTPVSPLDFHFSNRGFARGLLEIRARYDFDGVLIHKPGRAGGLPEGAEAQPSTEGTRVVFPDGGGLLCQDDEDPTYLPPSGGRKPELGALEPERLFQGLTDSRLFWLGYCGLLPLQSPADVPAHWYGCIDQVHSEVGDRYSVHGEVNSPFDALFHFLDYEQAFTGLLNDAGRMHALLEALTPISMVWAAAQIARGCEAVKISSPWAGADFISRRHYQEFVLPYERQIVQRVHEAGGIAYTHTCGAIGDRLDLLAASGVDGIECLDPPPLGDVDLASAVEGWGDRIFIKGNVDPVNTLLKGNPEGVRADAAKRLTIGARARGFILSSACSVSPYVPPENVAALTEAARAFKPDR